MSIQAKNYFKGLYADVFGELGEYLTVAEKRALPVLDSSSWTHSVAVVKCLQVSFRKDVDQIIAFAKNHFGEPIQEVRTECWALIERLTLANVEETKQHVIAKIFCHLIGPSQIQIPLNHAAIPEKLSLQYFKKEVINSLGTREEIQQSLTEPADRLIDTQLSIFFDLLRQKRIREGEQMVKVTFKAHPHPSYLWASIGKYLIQLQRIDEAVQIWQKMPVGADKDELSSFLIPFFIESNQRTKVIEIATSTQDVHWQVALCKQIAEIYWRGNRFTEASEMLLSPLAEASKSSFLVEMAFGYLSLNRLAEAMEALDQVSITSKEARDTLLTLVRKLAERGRYEEAISYGRKIPLGSYSHLTMVNILAPKMAQEGWVDETLHLIKTSMPLIADIGGLGNKLQTIAKQFIQLGRYNEAAEVISFISRESYLKKESFFNTEPYPFKVRCFWGGEVMNSIRDLIKQESFIDAAMLTDHLLNEKARDELYEEIQEAKSMATIRAIVQAPMKLVSAALNFASYLEG